MANVTVTVYAQHEGRPALDLLSWLELVLEAAVPVSRFHHVQEPGSSQFAWSAVLQTPNMNHTKFDLLMTVACIEARMPAVHYVVKILPHDAPLPTPACMHAVWLMSGQDVHFPQNTSTPELSATALLNIKSIVQRCVPDEERMADLRKQAQVLEPSRQAALLDMCEEGTCCECDETDQYDNFVDMDIHDSFAYLNDDNEFH